MVQALAGITHTHVRGPPKLIAWWYDVYAATVACVQGYVHALNKAGIEQAYG